jgi:hypothetical protein
MVVSTLIDFYGEEVGEDEVGRKRGDWQNFKFTSGFGEAMASEIHHSNQSAEFIRFRPTDVQSATPFPPVHRLKLSGIEISS